MSTEFEPVTENRALNDAIRDEIARRGGISFRDFMEMALYHPGLGYYTSQREKIGHRGDYLTSPALSPLFGAVVGRQLREMWDIMDRPAAFDIVECGAGTGSLVRDILSWATRQEPAFGAALRYSIVELSESLAKRQRARLAPEGLEARVAWAAALPEAIQGAIVSNELLDAMPVHRVRMKDGRIREIYVTWDGGSFQEEDRDAPPEILEYFSALGLEPAEGCLAEVNLSSIRWIKDAAAALSQGFLLTFDYGYEAAELYAPWRSEGTLLCFYQHNPSADPYARLGRQDMTAHVDFTSLRRAGVESGLTTFGLTTQSDFLSRLGIGDALRLPQGSTDMEEHFARRRAVMELLDPAGLGRVRVLVQGKDVGRCDLSGLGSTGGRQA